MSAFRATMLRAPLRSALRPSPTASFSRPLASFTFRPPRGTDVKAGTPLTSQLEGSKSITTSPPVNIERSSPLGDGGPDEIAHHGINVDKPIRMDT